ncbi:hypothetical protein IV203_014919 [Nitzschia inconspicua]|uniref:SET domain-containing protein n=1 Tax=Nitzschia inconspicua TaxID=303405 RepID=A0A9K3PT05_9STRA|nr:hypothetical protein IV203_014919 [Nitzschia inconspicua]
MYHPPLSASHVVELRLLASALAYLGVYQDVEFIHKLLAIVATNGHQYYGEPIAAEDGDLRQHETFQSSEAPKTALFLFGSKIAHSCQPNLSYTSKTPDGVLEYKVIRPIAMGDLACISYIEDLFETPTHKRREILSLTKSFLCECPRCTGPDFCRFIRCTDCNVKIVPCHYDCQGNASWTCPDCGVQDGMERKEQGFVHRLEHLKPRRAEEPFRPLQDLVKDATAQLSPSHHVTIQALDMFARLSASKANDSWPGWMDLE